MGGIVSNGENARRNLSWRLSELKYAFAKSGCRFCRELSHLTCSKSLNCGKNLNRLLAMRFTINSKQAIKGCRTNVVHNHFSSLTVPVLELRVLLRAVFRRAVSQSRVALFSIDRCTCSSPLSSHASVFHSPATPGRNEVEPEFQSL